MYVVPGGDNSKLGRRGWGVTRPSFLLAEPHDETVVVRRAQEDHWMLLLERTHKRAGMNSRVLAATATALKGV